ncbi:MAG: hypothetical protein ABI921_07815 [Panacibacter sp.]
MAKTPGIFLSFLLAMQLCNAQIKTIALNKTLLPKAVEYSGEIVNAVRWTDKLGHHIVVTTETGETKSMSTENEDNRDAALYAYHYLLKDDSVLLTWKVYDFIKECPLDLKANYIKNTFQVTDLDKNGKAEVWLMYKTVCHGDVSPSTMKIIMYEGNKKFAVRGTNRVKYSDKDYTGGEYTFDEAFKNGPAIFKQFATQLWKKNINETWD